jgi:hypothetical protein
MKTIAKFLLVGAVAVMAVAISAAPSEAAKKKKMKGPAPGTYWGQVCSAGGGKVMVWGYGSKWHPGMPCTAPFCPQACK